MEHYLQRKRNHFTWFLNTKMISQFLIDNVQIDKIAISNIKIELTKNHENIYIFLDAKLEDELNVVKSIKKIFDAVFDQTKLITGLKPENISINYIHQ